MWLTENSKSYRGLQATNMTWPTCPLPRGGLYFLLTTVDRLYLILTVVAYGLSLGSYLRYLITGKELAEKLPLPERTVRYLTEGGRIPVIRISPQILRYSRIRGCRLILAVWL